jgi:luciferase family oxidoreductase group 1
MLALQRDRRQGSPDDFPEQLAELLALLEDRMPGNHPFARHTRTLPGLPERPEPWLLGSSPQSAIWAAELGLPYAIADFINPGGASLAADYRGRFLDSERLPAPRVIACVIAICAETDEEAERLASSIAMAMAMLHQNRPIPVPPPEKALRFLATQENVPRRGVIGSPATVRAGIEEIASRYGAEEVIVVNISYDHGARRRSYELIADAFDVTPREETAAHAG